MTSSVPVLSGLDSGAHETVLDVFEQTCETFPDRSAFSNQGVTLTYAELNLLSDDLAAYFQKQTALEPGDRLAVMLPNVLQFPIVLFAALKAGLVLVPTNPFYTVRELRHQLTDCGARGLVFLDLVGNRVEAVLKDTPIEVLIQSSLGDMHTTGRRLLVSSVAKFLKKKAPAFNLPQAVPLLEALEQRGGAKVQPVERNSDSLALLQYTMGTTGVAKGAMLSHGNLVANIRQVRSVLDACDETGTPYFEAGRQVVIAPLPLYHIYAFNAHCLCMMSMGNHNVLVTDPNDTERLIKVLKQYRFNAIVGLNTLFLSLLEHPGFGSVDFRDLKLTLSGGVALARSVAERWASSTGCIITEAYGLTEASPAVAMNPLGRPRVGMAGPPLPETEVTIVADDGDALGHGEVGELMVRGPQVFKGYWQAPQVTRASLGEDGWLRTGDLAYCDNDGYVKIVDRKHDLISVSGFNVYPNEVENVLLDHPAVTACAAVGIPNEHTGELVKVFVVTKTPGVTPAELEAWCRNNLAGYKVPKAIELCESLPLTPVGKILRRKLRDRDSE